MRLFGEAPRSIDVQLGGESVQIERGRLGLHLKLGEILDNYQEAVGARDFLRIFRALAAYWENATKVQLGKLEDLIFFEVAPALLQLWVLNRLRFFPPFLTEQTEKHKVPWDYPGRTTAIWIHMIASTYGWSRQEILELEPEEAVIYIQEIMIDRQFAREWEWGLSDRSLSYNKHTKQTTFKPLGRPGWMAKREPAVVRIPKALLPKGLVIMGPEELKSFGEV